MTTSSAVKNKSQAFFSFSAMKLRQQQLFTKDSIGVVISCLYKWVGVVDGVRWVLLVFDRGVSAQEEQSQFQTGNSPANSVPCSTSILIKAASRA